MTTDLRKVVESLGRHAVPIFNDSPSTISPVLVGTGVLFNSREEVFLITAKHVVDKLVGDRIITGGQSGFIRFTAQMAAYNYTKGNGRNHDICVIRIPPNAWSELHQHYLSIDISRTTTISNYSKFILYAFVGYPHSKNKPKCMVTNIEIKPYFYIMREFTDIRTLPSEGKSEDLHVAFFYDFDKAKNINFVKSVMPPNPYGISGCGVWKLIVNTTTGEISQPLLVGIGIEYIKSTKAFVATRIYSPLTIIEQLQRFNKGIEE